MGKRVLVAVDLNHAADSAALYGVQLAGRINSPMALMIISPSGTESAPLIPPAVRTGHADHGQEPWVGRVVTESQRAGVSLEIFFASGPFFDEVIRFVSSQPSIQFVVIAAAGDSAPHGGAAFASEMKRLRLAFDGEILLVQKAGHVTRVSDFDLQNSVRETS
jgi:hypothetical protein